MTDHPLLESLSNNISIISILLVIFVLIGCVAFFSYEAAYSTKIQDRRDNAMIYDDSLQNNILGAQEMPEVELFKPRDGQSQQAQQMQQQQMMQQQQAMAGQQTMLEQKKQAREAAQGQATEPTKKPSPTSLPEGTFMNEEKTISFKMPTGWNAAGNTAKHKDGILSATVQSAPSDKSPEEFAKDKPFGREPKEGESKQFSGESGYLTKVYNFDPGGAPSRSISAFMKSKDGKQIIAVHVDSKNLDVNDKTLEETAKEIHTAITLLEAEKEE